MLQDCHIGKRRVVKRNVEIPWISCMAKIVASSNERPDVIVSNEDMTEVALSCEVHAVVANAWYGRAQGNFRSHESVEKFP